MASQASAQHRWRRVRNFHISLIIVTLMHLVQLQLHGHLLLYFVSFTHCIYTGCMLHNDLLLEAHIGALWP